MSNLDDFFAKKDKKKPTKKSDNALKTTELFKVLDNAAQNVQWDDQDSDSGRSRKELGPVLAEVLNPDEASKWAEPVEEERHYDLSNLKIESLQSPDEYEEANAAANADSLKSVKTWDIPKKKDAPAKQDEKVPDKGTPSETKENPKKSANVEDVKKGLASGDADAPKLDNEGSDQKTEKKAEVDEGSKEEPSKNEPSQAEPKAYVPPSMRNKPPVVDPAPAPKAAGKEPTAVKEPGQPAAVGKYVSPGARAAAQEMAKEVLFGKKEGQQNPGKKPELDSEQDFPTLGGPAPKRK